MTEKERMISGQLYLADDPELSAGRINARRLTRLINATTEKQTDLCQDLLRQLLGGTGQNFCITPPFRVDYGYNIFLGENFYANYDCIFLDVAPIHIGDNVFFAPRVSIYTAGHPIDADIRNTQLEYGKPVRIGNNVWVGGNTVINPGVTIGDNVVIGSGSVVTKDIPSGVVAAGVPCRVIRPITVEDTAYWRSQADAHPSSQAL